MFHYAVVTCADMKMMPAAICALLSVFQRNSHADTKYILVGIDLQQAAHDDIRRFKKTNGIDIDVVTYRQPPGLAATAGRWPAATLARLFIDLLLPNYFARVLYVDADILAAAPVGELLTADLKGKAVGAVDDYIMAFPEKARRREQKLGLMFGPRYFNAGVLLFDWKRCLAEGLLARARALIERPNARFESNDQDVLNLAFQGTWLPLPFRWNVQTGMLPFVSDPAVIHFTGRRKPWQHSINWLHRKFAGQYSDLLNGTPWFQFCQCRSSARYFGDFALYVGSAVGGLARTRKVKSYFKGSIRPTDA